MLRDFRIYVTAALFACCVNASGCKETYRVGDYVLVDWCDGQYPAYITGRKGRTRYRVHFDGYESRWDENVGFDQIRRRLSAPPKSMPPLCGKVALALGIKKVEAKDHVSPYKVGASVKVTWRGSVYKATIVEVVDAERFKVHYDGYESAWDEVISTDRIAGAAQ